MRSTISTRRPASSFSVHSPRAGTSRAISFASIAPSSRFGRRFTCSLRLRAASSPSRTQRLRKRSTVAVPMPSPCAMSASTSAPQHQDRCPAPGGPGARSPSDPGAPVPKGSPGRAFCPESWPRSCHCAEDLRACPLSRLAHGAAAACLFGILPVWISALPGFQRTPTRKYYPPKTINTMSVDY